MDIYPVKKLSKLIGGTETDISADVLQDIGNRFTQQINDSITVNALFSTDANITVGDWLRVGRKNILVQIETITARDNGTELIYTAKMKCPVERTKHILVSDTFRNKTPKWIIDYLMRAYAGDFAVDTTGLTDGTAYKLKIFSERYLIDCLREVCEENNIFFHTLYSSATATATKNGKIVFERYSASPRSSYDFTDAKKGTYSRTKSITQTANSLFAVGGDRETTVPTDIYVRQEGSPFPTREQGNAIPIAKLKGGVSVYPIPFDAVPNPDSLEPHGTVRNQERLAVQLRRVKGQTVSAVNFSYLSGRSWEQQFFDSDGNRNSDNAILDFASGNMYWHWDNPPDAGEDGSYIYMYGGDEMKFYRYPTIENQIDTEDITAKIGRRDVYESHPNTTDPLDLENISARSVWYSAEPDTTASGKFSTTNNGNTIRIGERISDDSTHYATYMDTSEHTISGATQYHEQFVQFSTRRKRTRLDLQNRTRQRVNELDDSIFHNNTQYKNLTFAFDLTAFPNDRNGNAVRGRQLDSNDTSHAIVLGTNSATTVYNAAGYTNDTFAKFSATNIRYPTFDTITRNVVNPSPTITRRTTFRTIIPPSFAHTLGESEVNEIGIILFAGSGTDRDNVMLWRLSTGDTSRPFHKTLGFQFSPNQHLVLTFNIRYPQTAY